MKAIFSFKLLLMSTIVLVNTQAMADPTRPAVMPEAALAVQANSGTQATTLQLIRQSPEGYSAMLNGQMVKVGDTFAMYRVLRITADTVVLGSENGQTQLTINNKSIKTYEPE